MWDVSGWDMSEPMVWSVEIIASNRGRHIEATPWDMPWESYVVYPVGLRGIDATLEYAKYSNFEE